MSVNPNGCRCFAWVLRGVWQRSNPSVNPGQLQNQTPPSVTREGCIRGMRCVCYEALEGVAWKRPAALRQVFEACHRQCARGQQVARDGSIPLQRTISPKEYQQTLMRTRRDTAFGPKTNDVVLCELDCNDRLSSHRPSFPSRKMNPRTPKFSSAT